MGQENGDRAMKSFSGLDKSPLDAVIYRNDEGKPLARVLYSRPQRKDREVFGKLVPYGKVWRTGANEATEITFYDTVIFGDQKVKAGSYSLFTIPDQSLWTIILNTDVAQWGAYQYNEENDVVRVQAVPFAAPRTIDIFSMTFLPTDGGAQLILGWEDTYVGIPIEFAD